jgi:hypothetical protein
VERAEVEIALDHVVLEGAVGEIGHAVGATRLGGIIGAVDVVDRDEFLADLAADHAVFRHIRSGADLGFGHGCRFVFVSFGCSRA